MNKDIPDLDKRVAEFIPGDLRYACSFWGEYLQRSVIDEGLYDLVRKFIFEHLLHWLEVMSLIGMYDPAYASLMSARVSLKVKSCLLWCGHPSDNAVLKTFPSEHQTERVDLLLADGIGFIQQFRIPIIVNAAQVYISALAFCSRSTSLSEIFHCRSGDVVNVRLGAHNSRTQCVATLEGHQDETGAVAVSPSGNMIVSGSKHGLLHLWDFNTGAPAGLPLAGHSKTISMVAFAPDGNFVASGSKDRTVRIRDRTTGDTILALYPTDRDALIATLAFSVDGTKLLIGVAKDMDTHSYEVDSIKVPSNPTDTDAEPVVSMREWKSPSYPTPEIGNAMCALTMALSITTDQVAILLLIDKINVFDMSTRGTREVTLEVPRGPTSTIIRQMVFSPTGWQSAAYGSQILLGGLKLTLIDISAVL